MEYKKLPINEIQPNKYNPNEMTESMLNQLVGEIKRIGFLQPILINTKNIIIDGEHRWKAGQTAGLTELPCIVIDIDEKDAKLVTVNMNQIKGELNPIKFAELLSDLKTDWSLPDLSKMLNMNENELAAYDDLINLDDFNDNLDLEKKTKTITCPECGHEFEIK